MTIIKTILEHESAAILNIPVTSQFDKAIDVIHSCVHINGGKLVCSGIGKAGEIAGNISTTFSSTGTPSVFLHPAESQHGDLGIIQPNDVMLLVSNSGKTREVLELQALALRLHDNGMPVICITGNPDSPLASLSDVTLLTGNPDEVCPLGMSPTTSTTVMTVIGDILIVLMMEKIDFTAEDYAKRHHGGYLGEKSRDMVGN